MREKNAMTPNQQMRCNFAIVVSTDAIAICDSLQIVDGYVAAVVAAVAAVVGTLEAVVAAVVAAVPIRLKHHPQQP